MVGHIFGVSASPRSLTKKLAMSPSSTTVGHGGQQGAKDVTFELSCVWHSWLTKFRVIYANQLVEKMRAPFQPSPGVPESPCAVQPPESPKTSKARNGRGFHHPPSTPTNALTTATNIRRREVLIRYSSSLLVFTCTDVAVV